MILTSVAGNVADADTSGVHIETCLVKSDDLTKRILRVKSDHGNEYGIRLDADSEPLSNGAYFVKEPGQWVVISVIPDTVIKVAPHTMDEMGEIAHFLGNLHKPVQIKDRIITLLYDPVVEATFKAQGVPYTVSEANLDEPMRYADLTGQGHSHE